MIKPFARRVTLAVLLGTSAIAAANVAYAQAAPAPVATNGVTGTDPVPPGCGCKIVSSTTADTSSSASTTGAVIASMLVWLGIA